MTEHMTGASLAQVRARLLTWYDEHKRDLPWRATRDPWAIWVSEVMLQQTRVVSVLDYYPRFLARFPTAHDLAEASWEELSALWAGLGYYRRARNLQEAAQQLCAQHGGAVPRDPERFATLKGVGRYTRGAVMSIAFDLEEPIVDGNVRRVFTRWYGDERDARGKDVERDLWTRAESWVKGERPGDLNQAIMELGATVCTPKTPSCERCPLRDTCLANKRAIVGRLPYLPSKAKALPEEVYLASLSQAEGRVWVVQAQEEGLLGGLWGLPMTLWTGDTRAFDERLAGPRDQPGLFSLNELEPELFDQARSALRSHRGLASVGRLVCSVQHRFTHKIWRLYVFEASGQPTLEGGEQEARCVTIEGLSSMGLGGPSLKAGRAAGLPLKARRGSGAR